LPRASNGSCLFEMPTAKRLDHRAGGRAAHPRQPDGREWVWQPRSGCIGGNARVDTTASRLEKRSQPRVVRGCAARPPALRSDPSGVVRPANGVFPRPTTMAAADQSTRLIAELATLAWRLRR